VTSALALDKLIEEGWRRYAAQVAAELRAMDRKYPEDDMAKRIKARRARRLARRLGAQVRRRRKNAARRAR